MKKTDVDTKHMIGAVYTKTLNTRTKIHYLSGRNQQKVVIGRRLSYNSDISLADNPTRGVDISAKYETYQLIFELAKGGRRVTICSSEMPEPLGICGRILVLSNGYLTGEYDLKKDSERTTQENIMRDTIRFVQTERMKSNEKENFDGCFVRLCALFYYRCTAVGHYRDGAVPCAAI